MLSNLQDSALKPYENLMDPGRPQIFSILVVMIILAICAVTYYVKQKKYEINEAPKGFVLIVDIYIGFIRSLILEILGPKFEKITPYFLFLMSYILLSNIIGIIGLENPTGSLTVTLSMGLVTWFGTQVIAFKYQKLSYLKTFTFGIKSRKSGKKIPIFINPLEVISAITPLISISFRLWGNIFAGSLVLSLWFYLFAYISQNVPILGAFNILAGLTAAPIHAYFDLLCGCIQALVFTLLTMVYWTLAKGENEIDEIQKTNVIDNKDINEKNLKKL